MVEPINRGSGDGFHSAEGSNIVESLKEKLDPHHIQNANEAAAAVRNQTNQNTVEALSASVDQIKREIDKALSKTLQKKDALDGIQEKLPHGNFEEQLIGACAASVIADRIHDSDALPELKQEAEKVTDNVMKFAKGSITAEHVAYHIQVLSKTL